MNAKKKLHSSIPVKLPDELIARIDKLVEAMSEPGMVVTRAGVLRMSIYRGVESIETDRKKR